VFQMSCQFDPSAKNDVVRITRALSGEVDTGSPFGKRVKTSNQSIGRKPV